MSIWDDTALFMRHANASISIASATAVPCWSEDYEEVLVPSDNEGGTIARVIAVTLPTTDAGAVKIGDTVIVDGTNRIVRQRRLIHENKFTHLRLELP